MEDYLILVKPNLVPNILDTWKLHSTSNINESLRFILAQISSIPHSAGVLSGLPFPALSY